jgi:hypothetical protein
MIGQTAKKMRCFSVYFSVPLCEIGALIIREREREREGFLTGESTRDDAAYGKRTRPGPAGSGYLLHVMGWGEGVGHAKYPRFSCELSELPLLDHRLFPILAFFSFSYFFVFDFSKDFSDFELTLQHKTMKL